MPCWHMCSRCVLKTCLEVSSKSVVAKISSSSHLQSGDLCEAGDAGEAVGAVGGDGQRQAAQGRQAGQGCHGRAVHRAALEP